MTLDGGSLNNVLVLSDLVGLSISWSSSCMLKYLPWKFLCQEKSLRFHAGRNLGGTAVKGFPFSPFDMVCVCVNALVHRCLSCQCLM